MSNDNRRYGVIEVHRCGDCYHLTIDGELWSEVEWSAPRQAWCIQDAAGQCLSHVEHIVGQDRDVETAIRLAKRMIIDGRMPAPEEALQQLQREQNQRKRPRRRSTKTNTVEQPQQPLGEPMEILGEPMPILELITPPGKMEPGDRTR